tara:strand:- start:1064 stop:1306 length:243 start_codon:yes stop_codon:yes gene_type:complete
MSFNSQIGTFTVSKALIDANPEAIMKLMGRMVILQANYDCLVDGVKYTARSEYFEEIPKNVRAPYYEVIINEAGIRVVKL